MTTIHGDASVILARRCAQDDLVAAGLLLALVAPHCRSISRQRQEPACRPDQGVAGGAGDRLRDVGLPVSLLPAVRARDLSRAGSAYIATGKVRWVFINFPLTSVHQNALAAAELAALRRAAECVLAGARSALPAPGRLGAAQGAGAVLPVPGRLGRHLPAGPAGVLEAPDTEEAVRADAQGAERSGASSTPTFYIEGGLLVGAQPLPVFRQVLDSMYAGKAGRKDGADAGSAVTLGLARGPRRLPSIESLSAARPSPACVLRSLGLPVLSRSPPQRQKHIVQRVGPRRDPEAPQQIQPAEQHAGHRPGT